MLDIRRIREAEEEVRQGLRHRGADLSLLDCVVECDRRRRMMVTETEALKAERNRASAQVAEMKRRGEDTTAIQASVRSLGDRIAEMDCRLREVEAELERALLLLPNVPSPTSPVGTEASANRVIRTWGEPRPFDLPPRHHLELGEALGIFDFGRATKMTGTGFPLLVGEGARLQRALINFMLDLHVREHGYREVWPPALCNRAAMTGTGQLPRMEDEMYRIESDDLFLIPTAEVPVTNFYRDEIIAEPLPIYLTAYTPCFRREAGAAGKMTRGLIRVHQFDKVEMVKFVEPEHSYEELESLVAEAEDVIRRLGLPYRVVELCSGDLSFAAAKCYDIELWAPGQQAWLEVSSCSNFEDFQARRAGIRYRDRHGKVRYVHTLNGSGVALARLVVALLENYQQPDGSVCLPEALVPYMGGIRHLRPCR